MTSDIHLRYFIAWKFLSGNTLCPGIFELLAYHAIELLVSIIGYIC